MAHHQLSECKLLCTKYHGHLPLRETRRGMGTRTPHHLVSNHEHKGVVPEVMIPHLVMLQSYSTCRQHFSYLTNSAVAHHATSCPHHRDAMKVHNAIPNFMNAIMKEAKLSPALHYGILLYPKQVLISCTNYAQLSYRIAEAERPRPSLSSCRGRQAGSLLRSTPDQSL